MADTAPDGAAGDAGPTSTVDMSPTRTDLPDAPGNLSSPALDSQPPSPDATVPPADADPGRKRIFHHAAGQLGSLRDSTDARPALEAADQQCTDEAGRRGYGGTWKAWLSSSTVNAIDRIADVGPWYRVDRTTKLFDDRSQLREGPLAPIEMKTDAERSRFWTGTLPDGTRSAFTCQDWTTYSRPHQGTVGRVDVAGSAWAVSAPIDCGTYLAILCIEQ